MALLLGTTGSLAENVIQAVPLQTTAGITADDGECIAFEMTNEEANIVGLSFMVKLPDGMSFDDSDLENLPPFELVLDRFPYTGRGTNKQYQHSVGCNPKEDGWWMVTISSTALNPIKELSGVILQGYYETDASMQPGVYPILMKDIKMAISGTQKAEGPSEATSYVIIGDNNASKLDMSSLTGYVPSFAVEQLNTDLATNTNLALVDLSGATELGAELVTPENVVSVVGTTGTLNREFSADKWSTVCLPFALNSTQVEAIKANGVEIETLAAYDEATNTVSFEAVDEMQANTPYIVCCSSTQNPFTGLTNVALSSGDLNNTTVGNLTFMGTFEKQTISSAADTYYAFDAADGQFVRVGSNMTLNPFRACMKLTAAQGARQLLVAHHGETPTAICQPGAAQQEGQQKYDLRGVPMTSGNHAKGIYIQNGQKKIER